jgi:murein DD-endopeptidase MepM/ murein hydrolase activator NlpD
MIELENTVLEAIPFTVQYQKNNNMFTHEKAIIREGTEGEKEVVYQITLRNGYQEKLEAIQETTLKEPTNALVRIGTRTTVYRGGRVNYGVVQGKRISSTYGWRIHPITGKRRFHDGLDIAANHGNSVYAYTDGRVIEAGWNGGYGNCVLIDHGNGLKTRYAHLSRINVKVGQKIKTGQKIGAVGSTGNSTGPHLHFEVIKNGKTQNPLNYL